MYNSSKLVDGYALDNTDGYSYTTPWVDVRHYDTLSMSIVFTGGIPIGTVKLQQSNDRQFTGGQSVLPLVAVPAENSIGTTKLISDIKDVGTGFGVSTVPINGEGVYLLDQHQIAFGWVRMNYTASSNANTQLDVFLTVKNHQS